MQTAEFDFELPKELIAQTPAHQRDQSRMMILHRDSGKIEHSRFTDLLQFFREGDVLVVNDSRVIRARLHGSHVPTQREFELLLLEEISTNDWWAMMRPARRAPIGTEIHLRDVHGKRSHVIAKVTETNRDGHRRIIFSGTFNVMRMLNELGEVPLPPYITRNGNRQSSRDSEDYQTVFAQHEGSVAAPTAGLHFTEKLLEQIRSRGVEVCCVTLHVGAATFAPVKSELVSDHPMHEERFFISAATIRAIKQAKLARNRIIAVGTTTVRVLESLAAFDPGFIASAEDVEKPYAGRTRIFIYPPHQFRIVDALLTNFHLPRSTLLMLVSAFAAPASMEGCDLVLKAYAEAIREKYRFFSYGDAMLLV
jgi:S-adenosylmethionine:tRNA ribosyltransferase-isomerase